MDYKDGADYLDKHGIDPKFAGPAFGMKMAKNGVSFQLKDYQGNLLGDKIRYVDRDEKYKIPKGFEAGRFLFNGSGIAGEEWVIYCEGEMDCIKLTQEGFPAVTGMAGVGTIPKDLSPLKDKDVYLCLDSDEEGRKAIKRTVTALEAVARSVRVIELPIETKDVCEYFVSGKTSDDLNALRLSAYEIEPLDIVSLEEYKKIEFPKTKWLIKGLIRGDSLNFVVGPSGVGKSLVCLSIVKAVAAGEPWLVPEFAVDGKKKVLILDKENSKVDLQNHLKDMDITGDVSIFKSAPLFEFVDDKQILTPAAIKLRRYVQTHEIDIILLDSMIDFYLGSEDSSTDFRVNQTIWVQVFGDTCVLTIHHENKPPVKGKRDARDRVRGSSNIFAQANSMISLSNSPTKPALITIENTKIRDDKVHPTFQIEMKSRPEYITNRSMVTGFEWKGNIDTGKLAEDKARDAILGFLAKSPDTYFTASQILDALCSDDQEDSLGTKNVSAKLKILREDGDIDFRGQGGRKDPYTYRHHHGLLDTQARAE